MSSTKRRGVPWTPIPTVYHSNRVASRALRTKARKKFPIAQLVKFVHVRRWDYFWYLESHYDTHHPTSKLTTIHVSNIRKHVLRSLPSLTLLTGHQGSSVINSVLNDPELSKEYKVRAITRDVNSDKVKGLKGKVEVVRGDVSDRASLEPALTGVHTVFSMTVPSFAPNGFEIEVNNGKAIADVALEKGAKYIIFSTFPNCAEISGGKYTKVTPFDAKAAVAKYIRGLPIQSAFLSAGSFMENFAEQTFLGLRKDADGTWVFSRNISPQTRYPLIDAVGDTGKFVGAILAQPEKYEGRTFCAATRMYTLEEIVATIAKSTGKKAVYKQISTEEFRENMGVPDALADIFEEGFKCMEEYGYFGPEGEKLVQWAADNARGQPATLEEYLERHPLKLE